MAMAPGTILLFFLVEHFLVMVGFLIWFLIRRRWNIPVVILKYTGDKRRPMLALRRGKRQREKNVLGIYIKGYRFPVKNFKGENWYPAENSPIGGLVLWEFRPGWLTPALPSMMDLPEELRPQAQQLHAYLQSKHIVDFAYDNDLYSKLMFKAVDDIDVEWYVNMIDRLKDQYVSGWREFLSKYGGHLLLVVLGMFMLVGFIVWLEKSPDLAGQCISAGVEAAKNTYLQEIAGKLGTSAATGVPPG